MTRNEQQSKANMLAQRYVDNLRRVNQKAEKSGSPRIPEKEYRELEKVLKRKLIR